MQDPSYQRTSTEGGVKVRRETERVDATVLPAQGGLKAGRLHVGSIHFGRRGGRTAVELEALIARIASVVYVGIAVMM